MPEPGDTKIYDLDAVNLTIAGILIEAGGGDDGFVSVDLPEKFASKSGVHGDVVTFKMGNNVATGTLTLLDPSIVNEDLFALFYTDVDSESGAGVGDFILEDTNSDMEITGQCRLTKMPNVQKTAEAQSFEWSFEVFYPRVTYRARERIVP
jgi:hypothetical protein